jgi:hypothetical protein
MMKGVFTLAVAVILTPLILLAAAPESLAQSLRDLPVERICRDALNPSQTEWDQNSKYSEYVTEAARRGLTVTSCRSVLAPESLAQSLRDLPVERICRDALNLSLTEWDRNSEFSEYVREAARRSLTVNSCRQVLAPAIAAQSSLGNDTKEIALGLTVMALLFGGLALATWLIWLFKKANEAEPRVHRALQLRRDGKSVEVEAPNEAAARVISDSTTDTPTPKFFITRDGRPAEVEAPNEVAARAMSDYKGAVAVASATEKPTSTDGTAQLRDSWWYVSNNERRGPIGDQELYRLLIDGTLKPNSLVWKQGMKGWLPARQIDELTPLLSSLPPEIPTRPEEFSSLPPEIPAKPEGLRQRKHLEGIGGWLILVAIGQVMGPMKLLVNIFTMDNRLLLQFPDVFYGEVLLNGLLLVITIYVSILFFRKSARFPFWFVLQFVAALLAFPLDLILVASELPAGASVSNLIDAKDVVQWITLAIAAAIWIPYINRSKRVANTFRKSTTPPM